MKFSDINESEFFRLKELTPTPVTGAAPAASTTTVAPGTPVTQDPAAMAKMAAQQALDRANQKKQIQELIKQKQQELQDLQKQLAAIK